VAGEATMEDLDNLEEIAWVVKESSLCGLGKTAPNPGPDHAEVLPRTNT